MSKKKINVNKWVLNELLDYPEEIREKYIEALDQMDVFCDFENIDPKKVKLWKYMARIL